MDTIIFLLKLRSFKWILAWEGLSEELQQPWSVNPMGAFLLHCKKEKIQALSGGILSTLVLQMVLGKEQGKIK